jgi:hypothetical protein
LKKEIIIKKIGNFAYMESLVLWRNRLFGTIPKEICQLNRTLTLLDLSENHFAGTIPTELGQLYSLKKIYLERNKLTGK